MRQDTLNDMKCVNANVDQMQVFAIISKSGMKINVDEYAKN